MKVLNLPWCPRVTWKLIENVTSNFRLTIVILTQDVDKVKPDILEALLDLPGQFDDEAAIL